MRRLLSSLELGVEEILTPDVAGNNDFISALQDFSQLFDEFVNLKRVVPLNPKVREERVQAEGQHCPR